jgi:peptidoglycan-N-acetylglucosamine deacetylase
MNSAGGTRVTPGVVRPCGILACCALAVGLRGGADAAKGWPQPALGETESNDIEVLFTFDDGPHSVTTVQVLDLLAQRGIRAVFFLVGKQVANKHKDVQPIIDRIIDDGHIIANHTMTHSDLCKSKEDAAIADLDGGREVIERATAMKVNWFRAPFGVRCDRLDAMLAERNLSHFHWDLDPQEWRHGNVDRTVKYVTGELSRASGRNVLLMHDIKVVTVRALPKIFEWMDEENAKRAKSRKRKIKVLQAPDLAAERLPPAVLAWLVDASAGLRELPKAIAGLLP